MTDPSCCCCWGMVWAYSLEEVKWAWVAWPQKMMFQKKRQGCTVKCYSLCEPKHPSWSFVDPTRTSPHGIWRRWRDRMGVIVRSKRPLVFCGLTFTVNEFRFGKMKKHMFFFSIAVYLRIKKNIVFFAIYNLPQIFYDVILRAERLTLLFREGLMTWYVWVVGKGITRRLVK